MTDNKFKTKRMNFIKLTQANSDFSIYVNPAQICDFSRSRGSESTMISYSYDEHYINVKETPEEIIEKLKIISIITV